ncbi:DUF2235 domain-containing protein [Luteimonas kalidii]|uniref:DUF2235 domain-containing protein n=1 Tax=Luteimonas kalidii TaxID=3042025 RepID=A0ABT6JS38_9GAMM|nr:DUF2235 domain-containing protein [Luteimonas kalidii]MDH5833501.1 DUF2235 domain-containing protein [Luteimonas kalidii]
MKRIAIYCDGTWNSADQASDGAPCPTNVIKLALRTAQRAGSASQVTYYGQGVGTGGSLDKLTGGAFGKGLDDNLYAAYRFLVLNYEPGDEIFLFGFSRGAYTARSLAGMVRKCGILRLRHAMRYRDAIALYCDDVHPDDPKALGFRTECSVTRGEAIPIRFVGVWDTVGALGIPVRGLRSLTADKYRFHDVELSGIVQHACQALAIDERRAPFEAARWAYRPKPGQTVEQVWFCGVHSDVGGGYPIEESGLSNIALQWMRDQAAAAGLAIDADVDAAYPPRPDAMAALHESKKGWYRLTPGHERVIGLAAEPTEQPDGSSSRRDPTQSLHPSVLARWDGDPKYRPRNLRDWFRLVGDPRGAG